MATIRILFIIVVMVNCGYVVAFFRIPHYLKNKCINNSTVMNILAVVLNDRGRFDRGGQLWVNSQEFHSRRTLGIVVIDRFLRCAGDKKAWVASDSSEFTGGYQPHKPSLLGRYTFGGSPASPMKDGKSRCLKSWFLMLSWWEIKWLLRWDLFS